MTNTVEARKALCCKLQRNLLRVEVFQGIGVDEIVANRMHLEWDGGMIDLSLGTNVKFSNEAAVSDYMKTKIVPWLAEVILPNLAKALSSVTIDVQILPLTKQGETIRNTGL